MGWMGQGLFEQLVGEEAPCWEPMHAYNFVLLQVHTFLAIPLPCSTSFSEKIITSGGYRTISQQRHWPVNPSLAWGLSTQRPGLPPHKSAKEDPGTGVPRNGGGHTRPCMAASHPQQGFQCPLHSNDKLQNKLQNNNNSLT